MNTATKRFTVVVGIIMSIAMVGSLILPLLSGQTTQIQPDAPRPTAIPVPTFPPPPDVSTIDFDDVYLHPTGLFTLGLPTGWMPTIEQSGAEEVLVGLTNVDALSQVDARISPKPEDVATADDLSAFFSDAWLGQSWRDYWSWDETSRKVTDEGRVVIDFNLARSRVDYIARQESWIEEGDIYTVRVVTPENAPEELKFLLAGAIDSIQRLEVYAGSPFDWQGYFDNTDKHMIRYPHSWKVTDAAAGLPATIAGDGVTMVVETVDVALASESDTIDWIENWRSGVEALTVEAVEVGQADGYEVSYRLSTVDGAAESGLALLLNGPDNRLHVANARVAEMDVDLQTAPAEEFPLISVLDSFRLLPELEITEPERFGTADASQN